LVDRPLYNEALLTTNIAGNASTVNVQGGQSPALLVDMDAALAVDTNNGGLVESIWIRRQSNYCPAAYTVNVASSGDLITLQSGMTVYVESTTPITATAPASGAGYYTYTGATNPFTGVNTAIHYSGGLANGFTFAGSGYGFTPPVQFAFYHTRGTTTPIPGGNNNDYHTIFVADLPANSGQIDCAEFMPHVQTPVPATSQVSGLAAGEPVQNRGIYLQRGDRLYVAQVANGALPTGTSDVNAGYYVTAEGGYY